MRKLLLMGLFFNLIVCGITITRSDVVSTAGSYVEVSWVVNKINSKYPIYSTPGVKIMGEAYSYGNKDTPMDFLNRIAGGKKPRNWQSNYQSNPGSVNQYAGIDCSGLVTNSWQFGFAVSSNDLQEYTGFVLDENVKPGDIWWEPDHVLVGIDVGGDIVYESNPYDNPKEGQRVQKLPRKRGAMALSIFPQFYGAKPEDGEVLDKKDYIDISLCIYASGEIVENGVKMFIRKDGGFERYLDDAELISEFDNIWTIKKEDFDVEDGGNFTVKVIARNDIAGNGYKDEYEWEFTVDPAPPIVRSTDPSDNSMEVPINKSSITIAFSKPMDVVATADAVQTSFTCNKVWLGDEELQLRADDYLDYCKDYTITVTDAAMDTAGVHLDGNTDSDGRPGGDHIFSFNTEKPELEKRDFSSVGNVPEGQSATHTIMALGTKLKNPVECMIEFDVRNPGRWSVSGAIDEPFSLSPGGLHQNYYTSTNTGAVAPLSVFYKIGAECGGIGGEGYYWSAQGHMADHPDENQSPGKMEYPTPWITRTQSNPSSKMRGASPGAGLPDIGILLSGWVDGYGHILGKYGMETLPVKPDLKIINNPDIDISDAVKLLVIGSAGLKGFNSSEFEQKLEDYVVNGGNLLVLTQKYGSDLSILPGEIGGYGWNEDQS